MYIKITLAIEDLPYGCAEARYDSSEGKLDARYKLGDTISGSRSAHHFIPTSQYTIQKKQLSVDTTIYIDHSFFDMPPPQKETVQSLQKNDYVTSCFDGFWLVALIEMVNSAEKDYLCTFLHTHGPST